MSFFGLFALVFGIVVITHPDIIAYLIGFFFVFVGVNLLVVSFLRSKNSHSSEQSWKFGSFEIIKNRKK